MKATLYCNCNFFPFCKNKIYLRATVIARKCIWNVEMSLRLSHEIGRSRVMTEVYIFW